MFAVSGNTHRQLFSPQRMLACVNASATVVKLFSDDGEVVITRFT